MSVAIIVYDSYTDLIEGHGHSERVVTARVVDTVLHVRLYWDVSVLVLREWTLGRWP